MTDLIEVRLAKANARLDRLDERLEDLLAAIGPPLGCSSQDEHHLALVRDDEEASE